MSTSKRSASSRLAAYATAAGAVTAAGTANAAIQVYDNGGSGWTIDNDNIGFNSSGVINSNSDFQLVALGSTSRGISPAASGNLLVPNRLDYGDAINTANANVSGFNAFTFSSSGFNDWESSGPNSTGYVGLKFVDSELVNFGWAEIDLSTSGQINLLRFAVESTPDTPVQAGVIPEISSLALAALALGATGLFALRARKN